MVIYGKFYEKTIDDMPVKCHYCSYWELCEYPYVCPKMNRLEMKRNETTETAD